MEGYDERTYGDAFADVYDDWYHGVSDVESTVAALLELAGRGPVLELGVGTGRLAVPLAEAGRDRGLDVVGIDSSPAMLARLRRTRSLAASSTAVLGDMSSTPPRRTVRVRVRGVQHSCSTSPTTAAQARCFECGRPIDSLPGGRFVVEAFVPDESRRARRRRVGAVDRVRSCRAVDLGRRPRPPAAEGQFVELTEAGGVRLRPWSIRYATPAQLDGYADRRRARRWSIAGSRSEAVRSTSIHRGTSSVYRHAE